MQTPIDKALAGLNGTNTAAVAAIFLLFIQPMQATIDDQQATIARLEREHAKRCEIEAASFRNRAEDMRDAARLARRVVDRTVALQQVLAEGPNPRQLPAAEANKLRDYRSQVDEYNKLAADFDTAARTVCLED